MRAVWLHRSAPGLARADHLERLLDTALPRLLPFRFCDPAGVLLAMGEGHGIEGGLGLRVRGQRLRQRLRDFDVTRCRIELDGDVNQVAGLDARPLADLPAEADQELTA